MGEGTEIQARISVGTTEMTGSSAQDLSEPLVSLHAGSAQDVASPTVDFCHVLPKCAFRVEIFGGENLVSWLRDQALESGGPKLKS